ncbi:hypothetical protein B7486_55785 [cyanobacterium TDX16]|nr:hypothetical protein B7486_55785 [cyanobacterium TDX16]
MEQLRALGVQVAIDDFGTGYSSLSYLRELPIDVLKIDRSFVDGIEGEDGATPIVVGMLELAHTLGLSVVAEGIEHPWQQLALRRSGCRYGQGYLFGRPAPAEAAIARVHESARRLAADRPG